MLKNVPLSTAKGELFEVRMKASEIKEESLQKIRFDASAVFKDVSKSVI